MNKYHRQQAFDTTVALFCEGTVLSEDTLLTTVGQIDNLITLIRKGEAAIEVLDKIRRHCKANAVPGDFYIRKGDHKSLGKNGTVRGETPEHTTKTPKRRKMKMQNVLPHPKTTRRGIAADVLKAFARRKNKALSNTDLAEILGQDITSVAWATNNLTKDKTLKRRKAKKHERTNKNVKYVYEVAA